MYILILEKKKKKKKNKKKKNKDEQAHKRYQVPIFWDVSSFGVEGGFDGITHTPLKSASGIYEFVASYEYQTYYNVRQPIRWHAYCDAILLQFFWSEK